MKFRIWFAGTYQVKWERKTQILIIIEEEIGKLNRYVD